ncbi:MAG: hypothetical protein E7354_05405 [Clostridiales bacterium]|nr:hypothetical protein [Clostridiales bacterium]
MAKEKYNVKDPKYFDAKHLADYLAKELREKDFKIKYKEPKRRQPTAIGAMTEPTTPVGGTIRVMGNPAKMAGKLPDGWSYDPATNRFKNGNKAEAEYFDVEPLKKDKPLKEIVDMSDVMYMVRTKRPDLKVRALDTTTFGIDGAEIDNIDWKAIFGSKFRFDKATGTVQGETSMGQKLSFHVMTESYQTRKFDEVREATYTSNEDGVMQNGFTEGNRTSVEHTAQNLLGSLASMNPQALLMQANLHSFSPADARHLWETCNLVPDPVSGELAVQERATGVIYTDSTMISQLAIIYSLVAMSDRSSNPENNPLLDVVTRGDVNWEKFDEMYAGFVANPDLLGAAVGEVAQSLEAGENAREMREDAAEAIAETMGAEDANNPTPVSPEAELEEVATMGSVELKADGGYIREEELDDNKDKPISFAQAGMLEAQYEIEVRGGRAVGVYDEKSGSRDIENGKLVTTWIYARRQYILEFGDKAAEQFNADIASENWKTRIFEMCMKFEQSEIAKAKLQEGMEDEMEEEDVMVKKNTNNN